MMSADFQAVCEAQFAAHAPTIKDWFEAGKWARDITAALERQGRRVTLLYNLVEEEKQPGVESYPVTFTRVPEPVSGPELYANFL